MNGFPLSCCQVAGTILVASRDTSFLVAIPTQGPFWSSLCCVALSCIVPCCAVLSVKPNIIATAKGEAFCDHCLGISPQSLWIFRNSTDNIFEYGTSLMWRMQRRGWQIYCANLFACLCKGRPAEGEKRTSYTTGGLQERTSSKVSSSISFITSGGQCTLWAQAGSSQFILVWMWRGL